MELYTLDNQLRNERVIEGFSSHIWKDSFQDWGDFELTMSATSSAREYLMAGTLLAMSETQSLMEVETHEDTVDDEGSPIVKVTGRGLLHILDDRVALPALDKLNNIGPTANRGNWDLRGKPADIARSIFEQICIDGILDPTDIIPFINRGELNARGGIEEPVEEQDFLFKPASLWETLKIVCDTYNLGMRLVRDPYGSGLYFEVYTGNDRTAQQKVFPSVIYAENLDNLKNTTLLKSIAGVKNMAYVYSNHDALTVVARSVDPDVAGFKRRVLLVNASDIQLQAGDNLTTALIQRGTEELAKHREVYSFDGEVPQFGSYIYGKDYELGDLITERSGDGGGTNMRVTEQIFVSDAEGERSYPTLTQHTAFDPGTWLSYPIDEDWANVGSGIYWANV